MINIEDHDSLTNYLIEQNHIAPTEQIASRVLEGGVSNRTVWVDRHNLESPNGESWVLKQALHKLRVEADWFSDPSRVHREAAGIRWLSRCLPDGAIPTLLFEDHDAHIIAMTAVAQPHENWKQMLLRGDLRVDHARQFGTMLGQIHRSGFAEQEAAANAFADDSFFETLRLEPYYAYTASQVPEAADFLHALIDEVRQQKLTLVHGDYSPKNILVYNDKLILLDHEVIHFGDPAFDFGFSLTHILSKAHHLPQQRAEFAKAVTVYWRTYFEALGDVPWRDQLQARVVRNVLACLLARVAGRSPFEYLGADERIRQRDVVLALMADPPREVEILTRQFVDRL